MDRESAASFGIGLLLGAIIGGVIGILYAPHSGRITRGLIEERVHEARHEATDIIEGAKDKAEEIVKKAREKIT